MTVYSYIVKPQNGDGHQGSELREEDSELSHEAAQDQEAGKRGGSAKSMKQEWQWISRKRGESDVLQAKVVFLGGGVVS